MNKFLVLLLMPFICNAFYIKKSEFKKGIYKYHQKKCKGCIKTPKNFNPLDYEIKKGKLLLNSNKRLKRKNKENKRNKFKKDVKKQLAKIQFGMEIYASIKVLNSEKGLSEGQELQMAQQFSSIKYNLLEGNIKRARKKIYKIKPDGVIITQEFKDYVLKEINDYLETL